MRNIRPKRSTRQQLRTYLYGLVPNPPHHLAGFYSRSLLGSGSLEISFFNLDAANLGDENRVISKAKKPLSKKLAGSYSCFGSTNISAKVSLIRSKVRSPTVEPTRYTNVT